MAVVLVVLAGCGSGGSGAASEDGTKEFAGINYEALVKVEGAPAAPRGTLRMGNLQTASTMDPVMLPSATGGAMMLPVYDQLLSIDERHQLQPWLATKWTRPDSQTWRFTLRDDVVFHDGSRFDAETVKLNLERAKTIKGSPWAYVYEPIDAVKVVDATTVDVHFSSPQPGFPWYMHMVPGSMISPKAIKENLDLTRQTAGSGGWIWEPEEYRDDTIHAYHANPNYWNPDAVKVARIEIYPMPDNNARLNAAESGELDVMGTIYPHMLDAAEAAGLRVRADVARSDTLALLDREGRLVPALADPRVRKAIGLLIDRKAYTVAALSGYGLVQKGFASPDAWWFDEQVAANTEADVAAAKALLAEAGYPDGFTMDLPTQPVLKVQVETIAAMLERGGITANLVTVPDGQYTAEIRQGMFPAAYLVPSSTDPYTMWSRSLSTTSPTNAFQLQDIPELEALYTQVCASDDQQEQKRLLAELQRGIEEKGVAFPVGFGIQGTGFAGNVHSTRPMVLAPDDTLPRPYYLWVD
jgi:peptide/nickel transport system substrate-binding protein